MEFQGGGGAAVGCGDPRAGRIMASSFSSPCLCFPTSLCPSFVSEAQNSPHRGKLKKTQTNPHIHFRDGQTEALTWRVTCPRSYGKGTIQPGFLVQKGLLQSPSTVPPRSSESEWAVPAHFHIDLKPKVLLNRLGTHGGMAELCYEIYIAGP